MKMRFEKGFSAAELLIAIFVGAAFILTGYQLYGIIAQDSGDSRNQAIASNAAYSALRRYAASVGDTCGDTANIALATLPAGLTLPGPSAAYVFMTCPYGSASSVSKVSIYILYGNGDTVEQTTLASQG